MNCIIPSSNVKVLAKGLSALSKVGDELFIEFKEETVSFITLNQSKTVCSRFDLLYSFFSSYEINGEQIESHDNHAITCKIHLKILLPLFKGLHLDRKLEYLKISYGANEDLILFKMKYKCDDIIMLHKLRLMESEVLKIGVNVTSGCNNMCATSSFFNQLLQMFSNSDDEITFEIDKEKLMARNYYVGSVPRPKSVRSQVSLNAHEFIIYKIETVTTLNFSLKPLRTAIHFADGLNLNVGFNFEKGGLPMSIIMKSPTFEVIFIVATLNPYCDAQTTVTACSIPTRITQNSQGNTSILANMSVEDQEAVLNEFWNDFEGDNQSTKSKTKQNNKKPLSERSTTTESSDEILTTKSVKGKLRANKNKSFKELMGKATIQRASKENVDDDDEDMDVLPASPESPRRKKIKHVFGRCIDSTYSTTVLGDVLVGNSDSE